MPRSFNTSGPCHSARDYMLPAMARLPEVRGLIERGKYFVIHAPRQTGKTTAVATLARELTEEGPEGRIDPSRLLDAFVAFWRQHGEPLLGTSPYHEIAPHIVLMAFLQRVINGGGTIEREYAIGRGRMDLCVRYGPDTWAIELKVWHDRRPNPLNEGLVQLDGYLAGLGLARGWLVIFDQRASQPPIAERTRVHAATTPGGREVAVVWA